MYQFENPTDLQNINIIIFDDHKLFAKSFKLLLSTIVPDAFITLCASAEEVNQHIDNTTILFTDYMMPGVDTLSLIQSLKAKNKNLKVIVVSGITNTGLIARILKNGVNGFLSKASEIDEIELGIKEVLAGSTYISREVQQEVMQALLHPKENIFTPRELEIIKLIKEGKSIKEKASILFLSENTIIVHRKNIMQKAGVKSVTELLAKLDDFES